MPGFFGGFDEVLKGQTEVIIAHKNDDPPTKKRLQSQNNVDLIGRQEQREIGSWRRLWGKDLGREHVNITRMIGLSPRQLVRCKGR